MQIVKKNIDQLTNELEKTLAGKKLADVITIPVGEALFPNRLPPRKEIILLDAEGKCCCLSCPITP